MNQYIVSVGAFTDAFKSEDLGYDHFCLTVVFFAARIMEKNLSVAWTSVVKIITKKTEVRAGKWPHSTVRNLHEA